MKQFFILGASSVYGVGAENNGWGDLVKEYIHSKQYYHNGPGEMYEVFNFSKAGSTVEFVAETTPWIYEHYARSKDVVTLISVGGNDAKADNGPENFVCEPEDFKQKVEMLFKLLATYSTQVIFVSNGYVDESKVNPKLSPFGDGGRSYFTNQRRSMFNEITREICLKLGMEYVAVSVDESQWVDNYLYDDGLHPNQAGYQKVFESVQPLLDDCLKQA